MEPVRSSDDSTPAAEIVGAIGDAEQARRVADEIGRLLGSGIGPMTRARWMIVADRLEARFPGATGVGSIGAWRERAFRCVAEVVEREVALPTEPARLVLAPGRGVKVRCPARVDLAGGWSDTPPICHGIGGTVLNAAVRIGGESPVRVRVGGIAAREIRIAFREAGESVVLRGGVWPPEGEALGRWDALARAALAMTGLAPAHADAGLDAWLDRVGAGLEIEFGTGLPQGSGMGTSSILGAALLAAMSTATGEAVSFDALCARTSAIEQMIGAGGGWQDQGGGVVPGFKVLRTEAGERQVPRVERLAASDAFVRELESRSVLVFSGIRRVAAGILSNVVERYLAREPGMMAVLGELKANAEAMAGAVRAGDVDAFAGCLGAYWHHKVTIDPASTSEEIEAMVDPVRGLLSAWELPGAGGGGFLLMIARDAPGAEAVRASFRDRGMGSSIHEVSFDDRGMSVRQGV